MGFEFIGRLSLLEMIASTTSCLSCSRRYSTVRAGARRERHAARRERRGNTVAAHRVFYGPTVSGDRIVGASNRGVAGLSGHGGAAG